MDVRWGQALDGLEVDRQAIIDCAEQLRASLASLKSDSRKIKDLATGEAYAGLFSELLLAVDRIKNEPLSEALGLRLRTRLSRFVAITGLNLFCVTRRSTYMSMKLLD